MDADDLDRRTVVGMAETPTIIVLERRARAVGISDPARQRNRKSVLLAAIAHVDEAAQCDLCALDLAGDGLGAVPFRFVEGGRDTLQRRRVEVEDHGPRDVEPCVGEQHADGGEVARLGRDDDRRYIELTRQRGAMDRPAAAEGAQREVARVEAALDGDPADRVGHADGGEREDAVGRLLDRAVVERQRYRHRPRDRRPRRVAVECQFAAQEHARSDPAERQIGVRHRGLGSAPSEGDRARVGARASRPDMKPAGVVDPGDRAATGADLDNVDHRAPDREAGLVAADEVGRMEAERAVANNRALGRRAPHVEGDQVGQVERGAIDTGPDAAADRAGFDKGYWLPQRAFDRQHAAVRAHHVKRLVESGIGEPALEPAGIGRHAWADDGVGRSRAAAFVLVPLARQLGSGGHVDPRQASAQNFRDHRLVAVVEIAVDQRHSDRLDVERGQPIGQTLDLLAVGLARDRAASVYALVDLEPKRARNEGRVATVIDAERVGAVAAGELQRVAKSLGRHQRRARAGSLQKRVDHQRRAVLGEHRPAEIDRGLVDACHHAIDQVAIGRQRLGIGDRPGLQVIGGDIGERPAGIDGDNQRHGVTRFRFIARNLDRLVCIGGRRPSRNAR